MDTPTSNRINTSHSFDSDLGFIEPALGNAAREVKNKFVLVSASEFLKEYLPNGATPAMPEFTLERRAVFEKVGKITRESSMYEPMVCGTF
jgi:hypothetical protein